MAKVTPVLPQGFALVRELGEGGQANVVEVAVQLDMDAAGCGLYSQKPQGFKVPVIVAIRTIADIGRLLYPNTNESQEEKSVRVKQLKAIARELNITLHFGKGYPFSDILGVYMGRQRNNEVDLCYVMPLYNNSLYRYSQSEGTIRDSELRKIMIHILAALQKMHDKGIAHRDVTPSNILINVDGHGHSSLVFLADFGLSQPAVNTSECNPSICSTFESGHRYTGAGTIPFRAPESLFRHPIKDYSKLDIWAAGMVLLSCIFRQKEIDFTINDELNQLVAIFSTIAPYSGGWKPIADAFRHEAEAMADIFFDEAMADIRNDDIHELLTQATCSSIFDDEAWKYHMYEVLGVSPDCVDVLRKMLQPFPRDRPDVGTILKEPWFTTPEAMSILDTISAHNATLSASNEPLMDFNDLDEASVIDYIESKAPIVSRA